MNEKFIIEDVYYKKLYYNEFRIYISIEGVEQDLEIKRSNNSKEYYRVCEYGGEFFYTEELVKKALKLVDIKILIMYNISTIKEEIKNGYNKL